MKGKGIVQFFAVALLLVSIYQLSFNFVTSRVEKRADEYALRRATGGTALENLPAGVRDSISREYKRYRNAYLDSMQNEDVLNLGVASFTYQRAKEQQLNLGLDLQGGMNVVLQVSMRDLIRSLADNSTDPSFNRALDLADQRQNTEANKDYVSLFLQSYKETNPTGNLATVFATKDNADRIQYNSSDADVERVIREEAQNAFSRTFNILRSRIDKFGVASPGINADASTGRITVELPGVDNPARVRKLLQASAKLEFWETYTAAEIYPTIENINNLLGQRLAKPATGTSTSNPLEGSTGTNPLAPMDTTNPLTGAATPASNDSAAVIAQQQADNPLFALMYVPNFTDEADGRQKVGMGPEIGYVLGRDTAKVNDYLAFDFVRAALPRNVKFAWSARPVEGSKSTYALYALKKQGTSDDAPLDGSAIVSARNDVNQNNQVEVAMNMNPDGAKIWRLLTQKQVNKYGPGQNGFIAITLDENVQSAPRVNEEIPNGRSSISGSYTQEEAKDLANILQAGKLPAPARIIGEDVVGPTLGAESIKAGTRSLVIAFLAVLAFMVLYYSTSGIVANIALLFNLLFIIGILASISATLTLPGIAGIVLTMGMAVDANVLIHERIKEELRKGSALIKAVNDGHTKSYSAIFDSNVTTLLTGLILAYFGMGPVLGFATTLNIGILMTLFTAVFMAHLVMDIWLRKNPGGMKFSGAFNFDFSKYDYQFINKRKYAYVFSGVLILVGLTSIIFKGFDYGVDFKGGRSYVVQLTQPVSTTDIRQDLTATFGSAPVVKTYGTNNQVKITTPYLIENNTAEADSMARRALYAGLQKHYGNNVDYAAFTETYQLSSTVIGPTISDDIRRGAIKAMFFALFAIGLYIFIRFRKWQYSVGVLMALAHDVLVVLGIFSLFAGILPFTLEVDETFVAALLTVVGFSVNDSVIVYDRIREYTKEHPTVPLKKAVNDAINQTLNRTITTSFTVLLVLLTLFIFGGEVLRGFSFAMIIGVVFGSYSSIFVATPALIDMSREDKLPPLRSGAAAAPKHSVAKH